MEDRVVIKGEMKGVKAYFRGENVVKEKKLERKLVTKLCNKIKNYKNIVFKTQSF